MKQVILTIFLFFGLFLPAYSLESSNGWAQLEYDERSGHGRLLTAIKSLVSADPKGPEILLVSVIHYGMPTYYSELQDTLDKCDLVFYEDLREPPSGWPRTKLSMGFWRDLLLGSEALIDAGLVPQWDVINYHKTHFNWLDADYNDFIQAYESATSESRKQYLIDLGGRPHFFGRRFHTFHDQLQSFYSFFRRTVWGTQSILSELVKDFYRAVVEYGTTRDGDSQVMIQWRNAIVLEGSQKQYKKLLHTSRARAPRQVVAIFYGASHMPDLEQRLARELNLTEGKTTWLEAWKF